MSKQQFDMIESGFKRQLLLHTPLEIKFSTGIYYRHHHHQPQQQFESTCKENNAGRSSHSQVAQRKFVTPDDEIEEFGGSHVMIKQEKIVTLDDDDDGNSNKNNNNNSETSRKNLRQSQQQQQQPTTRNHVQLSLYNAVSDERQVFLDKIDALYSNSNNQQSASPSSASSSSSLLLATTLSSNHPEQQQQQQSSSSSFSSSALRPVWYYAEGNFIYDQNPNNLWRSFDNFGGDENSGFAPKTPQEAQHFRRALSLLSEEPAKYLPLLRYTCSLLYWRTNSKLILCQLNILPAATCLRTPYSTLGFTHINHLVHLTGTVVRISTSVSVCTQMTYSCNNCGQVQVLPVFNGILNFPGTCLTKGCNSSRFTPRVNGQNEAARTLCDSVQYAKLQEDSSSTSSGGGGCGGKYGASSSSSSSSSSTSDPDHFVYDPTASSDTTHDDAASSSSSAMFGGGDMMLSTMMMFGSSLSALGSSSSSSSSSTSSSSVNNNNSNNNNNNSTGGRSLIEISLKGRFRNALSPGDNISVVGLLTSRKLEAGGRGTKAAQLLSCEVHGLRVVKASSAGMSLSSSLSSTSNRKDSDNSGKQHQQQQQEVDPTSSTSIPRSRLRNSRGGNNGSNGNINPRAILGGIDLLPLLLTKFCPSIYGHIKTKAALLLALVGGTQKPFPEAPRSQIHVLMLGDAGIGKSQLLRASWQASRRGVFVTANSTSSCGLTVTISRTSGPSGGGGGGGGDSTTCEAGAVMYGDGGVTCIDEIDKGHASEQKALLEVMEQQTVSIAKAGVVFSMPIRTSVVAAGNPRSGRFDTGRSYAENVGLSSALVSRFDFVMLLQDQSDTSSSISSNNNSSGGGGVASNNYQQQIQRSASSSSFHQAGFPRISELIGPLRSLYPDYQTIIPALESRMQQTRQQFGANYHFLPHEEAEIIGELMMMTTTTMMVQNGHPQNQYSAAHGDQESKMAGGAGGQQRPGANKNSQQHQQQQQHSSISQCVLSAHRAQTHRSAAEATQHQNSLPPGSVSAAASSSTASDLASLLPGVDVRTIVEHCQAHYHPHLRQEAQGVLLHAYLEARRRYFAMGTTDSAEITPRYLQSLIRATEARAKFAQRNEATAEDAVFAVALLEACRSMTGQTSSSSNQQQQDLGGNFNLIQPGYTVGGKQKKLNETDRLMNALKLNADQRPNEGGNGVKFVISVRKAEKVCEEAISNKNADFLLGRLNDSGKIMLSSGASGVREYVLKY